MNKPKNNRFDESHYKCPVEAALDVIGNKWKGVILFHLLNGTKRFNEIKRLIPGVSQRVLTLQLRELENDGILNREVYPEIPPKVEYSLTPLGNKLEPVLIALRTWGEQVLKEAENANDHPSEKII